MAVLCCAVRGIIGGRRGGSRAAALKAASLLWGKQWQGAECRPLWASWLVTLPLAVARWVACGNGRGGLG